MRLTTRVDLNVGYSCNIRCAFCYYQQTVRGRSPNKDLDSETVRRQLAYVRRQGIDTVDFTGGEPTLRRDLVELVRYARGLGFRSVCLITNGLLLSRPDAARRYVEAGVDDVLVSIHSHRAEVHDRLTCTQGSFGRAVAAVKNLSELPVRVRVNCVVNGLNHVEIAGTAAFFAALGVPVVNFILFNPIVEAHWSSAPELNVSYSDAAAHLQEAIDAHGARFRRLTVRYLPFCLMRGYERFVTNMPQLQYDPDEWDYLVRTTLRQGRAKTALALAAGALLHPDKVRALLAGPRVFTRESIKVFLMRKNKRFGPGCGRCAYRRICDGLWLRYVEWRGFDELRPVEGPPIREPTHFMAAGLAGGCSQR